MQTATLAPVEDARLEYRTLGMISAAHLVSHFYWLAFVPILPDLRDLLGVSFVELGFAITMMNVVTALTQAPMGFLVDRFGARSLLVAGLAMGGLAFIAVGIFPSYAVLIAASVLIGLANAVYHPADYSVLAAEMSPRRMGRAFSIHTFTGYLGFAIAPPIMLAVAHVGGARAALIVAGLIGPLVALPLLPQCRVERTAGTKPASGDDRQSAASLLTPSIIALTVMFAFINLSTNMLQTYMVVGLDGLFNLPRSVGNLCLTVFLFALVGGVLAGGFLADRARRQALITMGGFGMAAVTTVFVGSFDLGAAATVLLLGCAGFLAGLIMPSRDMIVRAASPPGAVGRVFGIVTTGFNVGGIIGPVVGGLVIDRGAPVWIFYISALSMLATVAMALAIDRGRARGL